MKLSEIWFQKYRTFCSAQSLPLIFQLLQKVGSSCNSLTSAPPLCSTELYFPLYILPLLPLLAEKTNCGKCGKKVCSSHPAHIFPNTRIKQLSLNASSCQKLPGQQHRKILFKMFSNSLCWVGHHLPICLPPSFEVGQAYIGFQFLKVD